jgi:hypothetical protein
MKIKYYKNNKAPREIDQKRRTRKVPREMRGF